MKVVIIKYNAGNIQSVLLALQRLGVQATVSNDLQTLEQADKIIFPGVGEASSAMAYLHEHKLDALIVRLKQPVLGICLGMQLLCTYSEEGNTKGLNIFQTEVKKFQHHQLKVPQIGWNSIVELKGPLFEGIEAQSYFYFVHSYYACLSSQGIAHAHYGHAYDAALQNDNFFGVQFHPEKSGPIGEQLLHNFLKL